MTSIYQKIDASGVLRDYVESIWVQESAAVSDAIPTTILPTGRVELVLQFGDRFERLVDGERDILPSVHVVGQQVEPITVQATGRTGFVIVRFKPWGAASLFGAVLSEIGNRIVDLDLMWPTHSINTLISKVCSSRSQFERVLHIESFIAKNIQDSYVDKLAAEAVVRMNENWGRGRMRDLASQLGISRRQFGRRFKDAVGASPKTLSRIIRAQKAVACLRSGQNAQDIVEMCGFADQSHLIQEVVMHCNKRPTELRQLQPSNLQRYFNANSAADYCGSVYL